MKKLSFAILLCAEWIFGTVILATLFEPGCIYSLMMIGINAMLVWIAAVPICRVALRKDINTVSFLQNGILALNAAELLIMYILLMLIFYSI